MKPHEIGQDPIKGDWVSNYIINDYFPPESVFSIGDDIVLSFEISDMLGHDFIVQCSSLHASNNTLTRGLRFAADGGQYGVHMSDNVGGINVTFDENVLGGGKSYLIVITISNATENHVGLYSCAYRVRLTTWEEYPSAFEAITGTKLSLRQDTEWPTSVRYEMGYNLLGGEIDEEAMMEEGHPNVLKCIVTAWQFPSNISLYFQDEYLPLYGPLTIGLPSYNSIEYGYRFAGVTTANAGIYKWVLEIGNQVIEKDIEVGVASA